jgi:hypothetical protein
MGGFTRDVLAVKMFESDFQSLLVLLQVTIDRICVYQNFTQFSGNLGSHLGSLTLQI